MVGQLSTTVHNAAALGRRLLPSRFRRSNPMRIQSAYPPPETLHRIGLSFEAELGRTMLFSAGGRVLGRIEGDRFKMVIRPSFGSLVGGVSYPRPYFVGRVVADGDGSLVVGQLNLTTTKVFAAVWFGFLGMFLPLGLVAAVLDPSSVQLLALPLGGIPLGAILFWIVRGEQERDAGEIEAILTSAVSED
jgi:hypothetical protein